MSSSSSKWHSATSSKSSSSKSTRSSTTSMMLKTKKKSLIVKRSSSYISNVSTNEFMTLLNNSLKAYYGVSKLNKIHNPFIQEDLLFWRNPDALQAINNHVTNGYRLLHSKNLLSLDLNCNVLCMTIAIANSMIWSRSPQQLSVLEKVYLFVVSLLAKNRTDPPLPVFIIKKSIEDQIHSGQKDLVKKEQELFTGDESNLKRLKQSLKNRKKRIENLQKQLENISKNNITPALKHRQKVNICRYPDCLHVLSQDLFFKHIISKIRIPNSSRITNKTKYLVNQSVRSHPYQDSVVQALHKLCVHLPEILKGLIWIMYSQQKTFFSISPKNIPLPLGSGIFSSHSNKITVNLDLYMTKSFLFPVSIVYEFGDNPTNDYQNIYYLNNSPSLSLRHLPQNYTGYALLGCLEDLSTISNMLKLGNRINSKGKTIPCSFFDAITPKYTSHPIHLPTQSKVIDALKHSSRLLFLERQKKTQTSNIIENLPKNRITYHWRFVYIKNGKVVKKTISELWGV